MNHECSYCRSSKTRRALRDLVTANPNMTTTRVAVELNINRNYAQTTRKRMDRLGCVPPRTISGYMQGRAEMAARRIAKSAVTQGGAPLTPTMPGDVAAVVASFARPRQPMGRAWPIGTCHYGIETQRAA